jgi:lysophospholipase L1-like esterase
MRLALMKTTNFLLLGLTALAGSLACSVADDPDAVTTGGTSTGTAGSASSGGSTTTGGTGAASGGMVSTAGRAGSTSTGGSAGSATTGGSAGSATTGGSGGAAGGSGGAAGGSGGAAGGSGGGSGTFDPCPATGDCKIVPLGDSITFGTPQNNGGYRVGLFAKAVADNKHITFVGSASPNGPTMVAGMPFPRANEGFPGITTANLNSQHVKGGTALKDMPHIILLHIGTNNVAQANAFADLEKIVDDLVAMAPNSLLAVAAIIPFNSSVPPYNKGIPAMVEKKAAAGKHVIFVDQNKDFPSNGLVDGVHPTVEAYAFMGEVWYAAIKQYLH